MNEMKKKMNEMKKKNMKRSLNRKEARICSKGKKQI